MAKAVERVGDIQEQIGDAAKALETLLRAEALYQELPAAVVATSDTSQLRLRISRLQRRMGRPDDALRSVEQALSILGEPDPSNDISLVYYYYARVDLGGALLDLGQADEAVRSLEPCRPFYEQKARQFGNVANSWGDLATCYQNLGYAYRETGRLEQALECHRKELEGQESYQPHNTPNEGDPRARLAQCHLDVGHDLLELGRIPEARRSLQDGLAILDERTRVRSVDVWVQVELSRGHFLMARALARAGDTAGAEQHARQADRILGELESPSPDDRYRRAGLMAMRLAMLAPGKPDTQLTDSDRAERRRLAGLAVAALREAVAAGFLKATYLKNDPVMEPLCSNPEFQQLLRSFETRAQSSGGRPAP
jgi:tetratricopeptide (TPR) repeat protein